MTFLEKCLDLAEIYAKKNQIYLRLLSDPKTDSSDLLKAEQEKESAKEKYIAFIRTCSKVDLHDTI